MTQEGYMDAEIEKTYRDLEIPGAAQILEGNGGLPKVRITTPDVVGEIYLHGAHVTSWKPSASEEMLFLSSQSRWQDGRAIRGGVPICFPWFGSKADDPKAPAHGFARTKLLEEVTPIQRLDRLERDLGTAARIYVKRDDLMGLGGGIARPEPHPVGQEARSRSPRSHSQQGGTGADSCCYQRRIVPRLRLRFARNRLQAK